MQLPDEAIAYNYQGLLVPPGEAWTPAAEMRRQHFLSAAEVREIAPRPIHLQGPARYDYGGDEYEWYDLDENERS